MSKLDTPSMVERRSTHVALQRASLWQMIQHNPLFDLLTSERHSPDFTFTRYSYLAARLRLMCLFFACTIPMFSFYDFMVFSFEQSQALFSYRITLSAALFFIAYFSSSLFEIRTIRLCTVLAFFFPTLFYLSCIFTLTKHGHAEIPLIFSMMPYLILAMLGLFPFTALGGVVLAAAVFAPIAIYEIQTYDGGLYELFNKVWLFVLFAGISLWLQTGQLSMLMKLYRESTIDPLTELINRRVLLRQMKQLQEHYSHDGEPFSVMMFDLDRFKRINDTYGHPVGDKVLVMMANILRRELRTSDIIARFGGEEFMVVLPGLSLIHAVPIAERVASAIRQESLTLRDGEELKVTSSIGVTNYRAGEDLSDLLKRVDDHLYQAKKEGRDRVISG